LHSVTIILVITRYVNSHSVHAKTEEVDDDKTPKSIHHYIDVDAYSEIGRS